MRDCDQNPLPSNLDSSQLVGLKLCRPMLDPMTIAFSLTYLHSPHARAARQSLALGQTSRQRAGDVEEQGGAAEGALIDREAAPKHAEPAWPSGWRARHRLRNKRRL